MNLPFRLPIHLHSPQTSHFTFTLHGRGGSKIDRTTASHNATKCCTFFPKACTVRESYSSTSSIQVKLYVRPPIQQRGEHGGILYLAKPSSVTCRISNLMLDNTDDSSLALPTHHPSLSQALQDEQYKI